MPADFRLRGAPALLGQHKQPCDDADDDGKREEDFPKHLGQQEVIDINSRRGLKVNQAERQCDEARGDRKDAEIMAKLGVDPGVDRLRQQFAERFGNLCLNARVRLAEIVTARVKRTAQRADRSGIGRAAGHILRFERMLADAALDGFEILPAPLRLARDVIFSSGRKRDQRRGDERHGSATNGDSAFAVGPNRP